MYIKQGKKRLISNTAGGRCGKERLLLGSIRRCAGAGACPDKLRIGGGSPIGQRNQCQQQPYGLRTDLLFLQRVVVYGNNHGSNRKRYPFTGRQHADQVQQAGIHLQCRLLASRPCGSVTIRRYYHVPRQVDKCQFFENFQKTRQ